MPDHRPPITDPGSPLTDVRSPIPDHRSPLTSSRAPSTGQGAPILYCHCAYAQVVPPEVKTAVLEALSASGVSFEAVPDLCEMSARRDPGLAQIASAADGAARTARTNESARTSGMDGAAATAGTAAMARASESARTNGTMGTNETAGAGDAGEGLGSMGTNGTAGAGDTGDGLGSAGTNGTAAAAFAREGLGSAGTDGTAGATATAGLARTPCPAGTIVACYPRAVRWLFSAGGTPLPDGVRVLNMRAASAAEILADLALPAGADASGVDAS